MPAQEFHFVEVCKECGKEQMQCCNDKEAKRSVLYCTCKNCQDHKKAKEQK